MVSKIINKTRILIKIGDITKEDVDAIVNASNPLLDVGGGVCGAIHRAGGPEILRECSEIIKRIGRCKTGDAHITTGGQLPAKYVIHTVGPVFHGGNQNEEKLLSNSYTNSLLVAIENGIKSIAFPSISTGIYGYPKDQAARSVIKHVVDFVNNDSRIEEIRFVLFDEESYELYSSNFI